MVSSDFINRVVSYPLVSSACQQATAGLAWAKGRSACARTAAGLAESGLRRVADGAGPLLSRCEARIAELDRLACRQLLDRLESACPTVLQPTDKVVERGRGFYGDVVKPKVEFVMSPVTAAVSKVQSVKSAGLHRYRQAVASRQGQAGLRQFDQLIQLLGDCVDKCLPPSEEEKMAKKAESGVAEQEAGDEDEDAGNVERATEPTPADPARSLALAYDLGRRVSVRVADQTGRVAASGHRLVDRLLGRSSASSSTASSESSTRPPANQEEMRPADAEVSDDSDDGQLDRTDMSTD